MHQLVKITQGKIDYDAPIYVIYDGGLYRTVNHPLGWTDQPDYEIRSDGRIYRTGHHGLGAGDAPDYEFGNDGCVYRSASHPEGALTAPTFALA